MHGALMKKVVTDVVVPAEQQENHTHLDVQNPLRQNAIRILIVLDNWHVKTANAVIPVPHCPVDKMLLVSQKITRRGVDAKVDSVKTLKENVCQNVWEYLVVKMPSALFQMKDQYVFA